MIQTTDKRRLHEIIRERSFRNDREVTLTSGKKSSVYFDMKPTLFDPEASCIITDEILQELDTSPYLNYVGGMEVGAIPLVANVVQEARRSDRRYGPLFGFFIRKQAKAHGTGNLIEGLAPNESLRWTQVALLEDVTTTGSSVLRAAEAVEDAGGTVRHVVTVIDREMGARDLFTERGIEFTSLFRASDFS